ncbi:hypothetical protein, partial [Roseomonas mucosa]|uniref:hypothetical protein n=1 Tax=Roseomonas mucosa TaxID=207340 RepID=UPI0039EEB6CB
VGGAGGMGRLAPAGGAGLGVAADLFGMAVALALVGRTRTWLRRPSPRPASLAATIWRQPSPTQVRKARLSGWPDWV